MSHVAKSSRQAASAVVHAAGSVKVVIRDPGNSGETGLADSVWHSWLDGSPHRRVLTAGMKHCNDRHISRKPEGSQRRSEGLLTRDVCDEAR